ncbi:hypothetical protein pb186bvf_015480 [Paramecium bursaria]
MVGGIYKFPSQQRFYLPKNYEIQYRFENFNRNWLKNFSIQYFKIVNISSNLEIKKR